MNQHVGIVDAPAVDPEIVLLAEPITSGDTQTRDVHHDGRHRSGQESENTILFVTDDIGKTVPLRIESTCSH